MRLRETKVTWIFWVYYWAPTILSPTAVMVVLWIMIFYPVFLSHKKENVRGRGTRCSFHVILFLSMIYRGRSDSCSRAGTKACREKLRRDRLNDRFQDLSSILEPGRQAKTDKPAILDDAIRVLNQLKAEAQELKETNEKLLEEIKSLKAEKTELREEKLTLKADKEKMEQQSRAVAVPPPRFMPTYPAAYHAAANKMPVFPSYGLMPMWRYLPPAACDTSRDHELRPPAA
ncbi:transcription factor bHLH104 isoform X1 [Populus trichocarpa]|uniref:transcription factor bHLH104 isoform X1 n=1 Tax=Populus trichocarpa TaxID=3694 RepID=UPI000D1889D6|nr:transcription factor bHLH104 isoform X1 [Populus trichocarpa]|eukprot:XP_024463694.1 transcription factor bHLH104 isoform X1 [Populus trichocarpa]